MKVLDFLLKFGVGVATFILGLLGLLVFGHVLVPYYMITIVICFIAASVLDYREKSSNTSTTRLPKKGATKHD